MRLRKKVRKAQKKLENFDFIFEEKVAYKIDNHFQKQLLKETFVFKIIQFEQNRSIINLLIQPRKLKSIIHFRHSHFRYWGA